MKRYYKISAIILSLLLAVTLFVPVLAGTPENSPIDTDGLLSASEKATIGEMMDELEAKHNISVIIYFTKNKYPTSINEDDLLRRMDRDSYSLLATYADKNDAIIFLMSLDGGYRDYYFYRLGRCYDAIESGYEEDYLKKRVEEYLTENDFYGAALEFLNYTDGALVALANGESIVTRTYILIDNMPLILIGSLIVAIIAVFIMRSKMKSVALKDNAHMYTVSDSFKVRSAADIFLYRTVSRVRKPQNNSGGSSGSRGGSRGGGGGGRC